MAADLYKIFNQYWSLREQGIITGSEGDLYLYLINKSNSLGWKNPFNQSNALVCAVLGISEPTLIKHRNILKQVGLIDFESGKAVRKNTTYYLNNFSSVFSSPFSSVFSGVFSRVEEKPLDNIIHIQNNNTIQDSISADKSPPVKKIKKSKEEKITTAHWQTLVDEWFSFNKLKFKEEPSFAGADPRHMKNILQILEKRAVKQNFEWSEDLAKQRFNEFLKKAYDDPWMSKNFLLTNLEKFLDKIILNQSKNDGKNKSNAKSGAIVTQTATDGWGAL